MITRILDAYVRHYSDNGQTMAYVEWEDASRLGKPKTGRTEGPLFPCPHEVLGAHMATLFARANREGIPIRGETW